MTDTLYRTSELLCVPLSTLQWVLVGMMQETLERCVKSVWVIPAGEGKSRLQFLLAAGWVHWNKCKGDEVVVYLMTPNRLLEA